MYSPSILYDIVIRYLKERFYDRSNNKDSAAEQNEGM